MDMDKFKKPRSDSRRDRAGVLFLISLVVLFAANYVYHFPDIVLTVFFGFVLMYVGEMFPPIAVVISLVLYALFNIPLLVMAIFLPGNISSMYFGLKDDDDDPQYFSSLRFKLCALVCLILSIVADVVYGIGFIYILYAYAAVAIVLSVIKWRNKSKEQPFTLLDKT